MATINLVLSICQDMMNEFRSKFNASGETHGYLDFVKDSGGEVPGDVVVRIPFEETAFDSADEDGRVSINTGGSDLEGTVGDPVGTAGTIAFCLFKTYADVPLAMSTVGLVGSGAGIEMPNNVMALNEKVQISTMSIRLEPTYTHAS